MTTGALRRSGFPCSVLGLLISLAILHGCASRYEAPVDDEPLDLPVEATPVERIASTAETGTGGYIIKPGDTLYSIAWRYKLDYREVARWNGIKSPYRIYVGKRLRLSAPMGKSTSPDSKTVKNPSASNSRGKPEAFPDRKARDSANQRPAELSTTPRAEGATAKQARSHIRWRWPARGNVVPADSVRGERGINIFGVRGQPVLASADGKVVYSGSGLVGYGKLIIIEHSETYLSAYAHNDKLLVSEGARVGGGQQIAEMGSTGTQRVMLHFEIRLDGKPVPPLQYLP